jgi:hypothetical protein
MREEFEKWATKEGLSTDTSSSGALYLHYATDAAWQAWQAATALQAERIGELEEALRDAHVEIELSRGEGQQCDSLFRSDELLKALSATAREVGE